MESLVEAFDNVNVELYKKSADSKAGENFMVSPASILYACALTYGGARGATKENLETALHLKKAFNGDVSKTLAAFGQLTAGLNVQDAKPDKKPEEKKKRPTGPVLEVDDQGRPVLDQDGNQRMMMFAEEPVLIERLRDGPMPSEPMLLSLANGIFLKKDLELSESYKNSAAKELKAAVEKKDFAGNPKAASKDINDWVEDHTKGRIKDLIPAGAIEASTVAVLANAIYFKAHWQDKFEERKTRERPFYTLDGKEKEVRMMTKTLYPNYAESDELGVQFIELPYYQQEASMLILLPKAKNGLPKVEAALSAGSLRQLLQKANGNNPEVDIEFPKFKLDTNFDLKEILKNIGVTSIFEPSADLTGMLSQKQAVVVSDAFHKTFIEVNEEGTEAAAATAMVMRLGCALGAPKPQPIQFIADHPFLYVIRHTKTGLILFMGRVLSI